MNAEHEQLASAYLDGELTDEERRLADADPAVMADVERLRVLRAGIASVEPSSDVARERAIAAAIAVFGEIHGATSATSAASAASVTTELADHERGRDLTRWLGVAAAVVAVGLLGVVVAGELDGDDADQSAVSPADDAAEEPAAEVLLAPAATQFGADLDSEAGRITEGADEPTEEMSAAEEPAAEEPAEAAASEPELADQSADAPAGGDDGGEAEDDATAATFPTTKILEPEAYLAGEPIRSPVELAAVAEHLIDLVDERELPPTPNHACPFEDVLARGVFADERELDVYIAVNADMRTALAIDEETCSVVLRVDLDR